MDDYISKPMQIEVLASVLERVPTSATGSMPRGEDADTSASLRILLAEDGPDNRLLIGTFLEGETILMLGGLAAHMGYMDVTGVILAAFAGSLYALATLSGPGLPLFAATVWLFLR